METLFSDRAIVGDRERSYALVIPAIRRSWATIWKLGFWHCFIVFKQQIISTEWLFLYWRRIIRLGELGQAYLVRLIIRLSINTGTKTNCPSRRIISVVRLWRRIISLLDSSSGRSFSTCRSSSRIYARDVEQQTDNSSGRIIRL